MPPRTPASRLRDLSDDPGSRGTDGPERSANSVTFRGAAQQEVGQIGARQQQHKSDSTEQEQRRTARAHHVVIADCKNMPDTVDFRWVPVRERLRDAKFICSPACWIDAV